MKSQTSLYFFCLGRMLIIGPLIENKLHRHGAIQIILSLDQNFSIKIDNADWRETKAVLIDTHIPHQLKNLQSLLVSLSIVPERTRGKNLQKYILRGSTVQYLDHLDFTIYKHKFQQCYDHQYTCPRAFRIVEEMIDDLTGVKGYRGPIDERIQSVINWIQRNLSTPISAHNLAQSVYLSEDRFLHLFKEQLGLPLRQYIRYQRIMTATIAFIGGKSLTEAAYEAGFADSAHFTRTFVEMNGIKPSEIAKNKETFQFCFCSSYCDACNKLRSVAK